MGQDGSDGRGADPAQGAGLLAATGIAGLLAIGFRASGGALALAIVLPAWAAVSIVGGIFILLALGFYLAGRGI